MDISLRFIEGNYYTFIGRNAGNSAPGSVRNIWVDGQAGYNITNSNGGDNTFKGHDAGYNTNGGSVAGTLGNHNSFYGHESGFKNTLRNDIACKSGYSMNESVTAKYVPCLGFDTG